MDIPAPDPGKLLQSWMEWEHGDVTPGRVMANLKTGGLRQLLEGLAVPAKAGCALPGAPETASAPPGEPKGRKASDRPSKAGRASDRPSKPGRAPDGPPDGPGPSGSAVKSAGATAPSGGQPASWAPVV